MRKGVRKGVRRARKLPTCAMCLDEETVTIVPKPHATTGEAVDGGDVPVRRRGEGVEKAWRRRERA